MKKYYDLTGQRIVACLDWKTGYESIEDAKKYFKSDFKEISKKEFNKLGEEYSNSNKNKK